MGLDDVFVERVRNKSTEKNPGSSWDSNARSSEYWSNALTIKPLGPLVEEWKTSIA